MYLYKKNVLLSHYEGLARIAPAYAHLLQTHILAICATMARLYPVCQYHPVISGIKNHATVANMRITASFTQVSLARSTAAVYCFFEAFSEHT